RGETVTARDTIEAPPRWRRANLVDGYAPGKAVGEVVDVEKLKQERQALIARVVAPGTTRALNTITLELGRVEAELARLSPTGLVYAGTIHKGSGTFLGTGANGGKPRPIHVLRRGDVKTPGP